MSDTSDRTRSGRTKPDEPLKPDLVAQPRHGERSDTAVPRPVTVDNFERAETDMYFASAARDGSLGTFEHRREPTPVDRQTVVRMNRDTLYSSAVFDLDAAPVTITLPDALKRFLSMEVIDQDHYVVTVVYGSGSHTFTQENVGTRYVMVAIRILVDPADPHDVDEVHALQDAIKVDQEKRGIFEIPNWDVASQKRIRDALAQLAATLPNSRGMFGARNEVDPVRHLIGTAVGWGGNPEKDATYVGVTPVRNDGKTVHSLVVKDVPVDGFWSITVYNSDGYMQANARNAYSINNITATKDVDGSVEVQFGGCDGESTNCLPIMPGWNYTVRLYRPRAEILKGRWTFPVAKPVRG